MTFKRGKFWSLYVPRHLGGAVQRSTGTTDANLAKRMGRMIDTLADQRRWDVLGAIDAKVVTVGQVWDAFAVNGLDALLANAAKAAEPLALHYVDRWVRTMQLAARTVMAYEQKVRTLLGDDELRLSALTGGWLMDRLADLNMTPATVRQYAHAFSKFAQYLKAHRLITENPVKGIPLPKGTAKRTIWKSEADDLKLVNAAPEPFRSYFALVHATGAERDAALVMVRSDLDLTAATCHIPGTKNRNRDRKGIPIEPWALPMLTQHVRGLMADAPLFPTLNRRTVNIEHVAAASAAKLAGYQLRDARHSYAVRAILRGEQIWKVSKWLGHANIGITASVYANFELEDAMDELNRKATPHATRRGFAS
jgi:integrase